MLETVFEEIRNNARTRWLLIAALAIAWIWSVSSFRDATLKRERSLALANAEYVRLGSEDTSIDWGQRLDQTIGARNRAVDVLWREPTYGLAQARFQDWVRNVSLRSPSVRKQTQLIQRDTTQSSVAFAVNTGPTGPQESLNDRYWVVRARIDLDFTPQVLNHLLGEVQNHSKRVSIESMNIRREAPSRIDAVLVARFLNPSFATAQDAVLNAPPARGPLP